MKTHITYDPLSRRQRLLALAVACFIMAALLLLVIVIQVDAAPASAPDQAGKRVTEIGTITAVTRMTGLWKYVTGQTDPGHYFGAYTTRSFRINQRVRVTGDVDGQFLNNVRIR